jgi:hypothetical protein
MMKKFIIVATHPRSGTHFTINSICMNFKAVEFPQVRNGFATLEGLCWPHDSQYRNEWEESVLEEHETIKIIKTHLTPSDIKRALDSPCYLHKDAKRIISHIYENSEKLYVYRDCRDVLVSWFYYQKNAGGGLPQGLKPRLRECDFSEFIKMPNKYYMPIRGFEEVDENRVKYWCSHVNEWLGEEDVCTLSYESLSNDFEHSIKEIAHSIGIEKRSLQGFEKPILSVKKNTIKKQIVPWIPPILFELYRNFITSKRFHKNSNVASSKIQFVAYPRRGVIGDWRDHFTDTDLDFFVEFASETMNRLNYKI